MKKKKKIYLAVPYSHPDPIIRQARFLLVNEFAAQLMMQGHLVFSPISHSHPIAEAGDLPKGWDYWHKSARTFIEWCDEVHILKLKGWEKSKGIAGEIVIAAKMGKPVNYIEL